MTDREVIVNNEGRSTGALVAGIVAVLWILIAIWYFANNGDDGRRWRHRRQRDRAEDDELAKRDH